jgi:D-alanyl-D-alanine carboxypeptidase (penicillin-binding protein 5/6)
VRGWQQGAALLDWGFSLPRDASVGKLVDPDASTGTAAHAAVPATTVPPRVRPTAARPAPRRALSLSAAAAVAIVLAVTPLLVLTAQQRRRRVRRRSRTRPTYR